MIQSAILAPLPEFARYLTFTVNVNADPRGALAALERLAPEARNGRLVLGLGAHLLESASVHVEGHREYPDFSSGDLSIPGTQGDLWIWLRDDDRMSLLRRARLLETELRPTYHLVENVETFRYRGGLDLTGYEDGTENPKGERISATVESTHLSGSFVALQRWIHHFTAFDALDGDAKDSAIGRALTTNEELPEAPPSAHVKRTAQESFVPEAFVVRRSMPWIVGSEGGLYFVAFGRSLDAFEAQMRRMTGEEDGIVDDLFRFSEPLTGGYYFCPGVDQGGFRL
jgi:putative iron-dependent peroxidase